MIKYYYLIPEDDVIYEMIEQSLISLEVNENPSKQDVISYKENLKILEDGQASICYCLIKMGLNFTTPFKGYHGYTASNIKTVLNESRWGTTDEPESVFLDEKKLSFNGTDEYINFGTTYASLGITTELTIMTRFQTVTEHTGNLFNCFGVSWAEFSFYLQTIGANKVQFLVSEYGDSTTGKKMVYTLPSNYFDGVMHSLGIVVNTVTDTIKMFFDGAIVTGTPALDLTMTSIYTSPNLNLVSGTGYIDSATTGYFSGHINDTVFFNVAKSDAQMLDYHNAGVAKDLSGEAGNVFDSRYGDDTVVTTQNSIIGPNGTLVNMTEADNVKAL